MSSNNPNDIKYVKKIEVNPDEYIDSLEAKIEELEMKLKGCNMVGSLAVENMISMEVKINELTAHIKQAHDTFPGNKSIEELLSVVANWLESTKNIRGE